LKAHIVFIDESGFLMAPLVRRSWALRGKTPVLRQRTRSHRKVSAIAALCLTSHLRRPSLCFRLHADLNINDVLVIAFLNHLLRHLGSRIVLLWDRLNAHRSHKTRQYLARQRRRLFPHFLPSYAPEVNPVEQVWGYLKMNPLANDPIAETRLLAATVRRHTRQVQHRRDLLRSFLRHTPLSFCP
jgi:transposase